MKTKIAFLTLALICSVGFVMSCDDDDNPVPVPEKSTLIKAYTGTTSGSSAHFQNLKMPNVVDTIYVSASLINSFNFNILYCSSYWGEANFPNVPAEKINGLNAWGFETDIEGVIKMPYRNPSAKEVTYKEYPATLKLGRISSSASKGTAWDRAEFTIEANLGERAGIYTLTFDTAEE